MARTRSPSLTPTRRDTFAEELCEHLGRLPDFELRAMFGGYGLYAEGTMFGIVHGARLFLKVDAESRADFVARGSAPFQPPRGPVLTSYYEAPADVQEDERELLAWARRALQAAEHGARSRRPSTVSADDILAPHTPAVRKLAHALRKLVRAAAPSASEAGYPGWKLIGYRAPHYFAFISAQDKTVRLGFEHGTLLEDPAGLLEGSGTQVRYVTLEPGKTVPRAALLALLRQALEVRPRARKAQKKRR